MSTNKDLNKEQLQSLREAMKVFAFIGYDRCRKVMDHFNNVNVEVVLQGGILMSENVQEIIDELIQKYENQHYIKRN